MTEPGAPQSCPPPGWQVVHLHPGAPPKPPEGAPCNGCGVCCLLEPCPLGMVLSRKRRGACVALRWQDDARQYRCGAVMAPKEVLQLALPNMHIINRQIINIHEHVVLKILPATIRIEIKSIPFYLYIQSYIKNISLIITLIICIRI